MKVLFTSHMFSGIGGDDSPKQRFENLINAVHWPSHVTRLPKNVRMSLDVHVIRDYLLILTSQARPESKPQESRRMASSSHDNSHPALVVVERRCG